MKMLRYKTQITLGIIAVLAIVLALGDSIDRTSRLFGSTVVSAKEATPKAEMSYWSFEAEGTLHSAIALPDERIFTASSNGWITVLNREGKEIKRLHTYTSLSSPAINDRGQIWIAGQGARLYRFDSSGTGGQEAIFYFKGKTEGLQPSAVVVDGEGIPYFAYQHGILSLNEAGQQQSVLLPEGVKVTELAPGTNGVYALGSNGILYAVKGNAAAWEAPLEQRLHDAKLAAEAGGGVVLLAGKALAAYEADGKVRFSRELAAAPAGGWTSPVVMSGDVKAVIAAELGGNAVAAFRLADGAELWRISASGARGFAPAALAPESSASLVLAGSRSGAVYAIDSSAGSIAYTYSGSTADSVSSVLPLGGGRFVYTSASKLIAAGPARAVELTYPAATLKLPLSNRLLITDKLKLSDPVELSYSTGNPSVMRVNDKGVVTPISVGKTNLTIQVITPGYKGQLRLPVEVSASALNMKAQYANKKITLSGRTYSIQTITLPKGMPVTTGLASRKIGVTQTLAEIAKAYRADAAINGTYFEAYGGIPEPYGTIIADWNVEHIGNTGTAIGFTWDNTVLMDTLRVKVLGGTNDSFKSPNNWYAYFINRTPARGASSAVLFTPKRGAKLGFAYGSAVTVSKGMVTKISKNEDALIPTDGYVLVFTGSEEKLADRFKVGTKVDYNIEMTNLDGKAIDWSRVHTAVGAGPRLVKDGKLSINPAAEGFVSPKILTDAAARSGILVKKDGTVILATVPKATIKQWGEIMIQLGAYQAMNLDGGASSGMYGQGKLITTPGRQISNSLVFGTALKWE